MEDKVTDGWYEFSCMIKGVDFHNEDIQEIFRKKIILACLEMVEETGKPIKVACVSATLGTIREPLNPETVAIS